MSVTNPTGNPASFPATVERKSDAEPSTDFWSHTFDPLLNRTSYLKDQLLGATNGLRPQLASQVSTSSGVGLLGAEAHTGANGQGDYVAQTLFALLALIWDTKGGLDKDNEWDNPQTFDDTVKTLGRKALLRPRVPLTDADHTVDVATADRFVLPSGPAAPRVIKLNSTTVPPEQGETIAFVITNLTSSAQPAYTIKREDNTPLAKINGSTVADAGPIYVEFEFDAGAWVLGAHSGNAYEDNTFTERYGVMAP